MTTRVDDGPFAAPPVGRVGVRAASRHRAQAQGRDRHTGRGCPGVQREVSARRPACCRFSPSCSAYAVEALTQHGAARGGWLTIRRLIRCRPGGPRGYARCPDDASTAFVRTGHRQAEVRARWLAVVDRHAQDPPS